MQQAASPLSGLKRMTRCLAGPATVFAFAIAGLVNCCEAQLVIKAGVLHTMNGPAIERGVVVIVDNRIAAVGAESEIAIPPNSRILEAAVVTPGLIDGHGTAGLSGIHNQPHDQDQLDNSGPIQPELRAQDAVNVREELLDYLREYGITTIHTGHAPGELVSGQTMILKNVGGSVDEAQLVGTAAVLAHLGTASARAEGSPGTRGKQMAMLRQELIKAQEYMHKQKAAEKEASPSAESETPDSPASSAPADSAAAKMPGKSTEKDDDPARDLRMESLAAVLRGEVPLMVTANKSQDISTALRLAGEFNFKLWLDGAAESYLLIDELKAAKVPVFLHPTMIRAAGEYENLSFETGAKLTAAGIPVVMQSGFEGYVPKTRVVLFEAAVAAANGMQFDQALAMITRDAARALGVAERIGTLEVGKDADLALFDGDPFEYTSHCIGVVINGQIVSETKR